MSKLLMKHMCIIFHSHGYNIALEVNRVGKKCEEGFCENSTVIEAKGYGHFVWQPTREPLMTPARDSQLGGVSTPGAPNWAIHAQHWTSLMENLCSGTSYRPARDWVILQYEVLPTQFLPFSDDRSASIIVWKFSLSTPNHLSSSWTPPS